MYEVEQRATKSDHSELRVLVLYPLLFFCLKSGGYSAPLRSGVTVTRNIWVYAYPVKVVFFIFCTCAISFSPETKTP